MRLVRLGARRWRSALELCGDGAPASALKAARRWTRELGRVRSLDVLAIRLEEARQAGAGFPARAAAEHLLEALMERREKARRDLSNRLGKLPVLEEPNATEPLPPPPEAMWAELAPLLRGALEPLPEACRTRNEASLHHVRLAVKRLRHALEVLGPAFPFPPDQALVALKMLQDALGLCHDWRELMAFLDEALVRFGARGRLALAEGVEPLLARARLEHDLALDQVTAFAGELAPLDFALLLRRNLGDPR